MKLTRKDLLKTAGAAAALIIPGCTRIDMIGQFEDNQLAVENLFVEMISVPGGTFSQTDGTTSFWHTISSFKIAKLEVSYKIWYDVFQWASIHGYNFQNAGKEGNNGTAGAAPTTLQLEPVTAINWRDAIVWCNAYSEKKGITPVYYTDAAYSNILKDSINGGYAGSINTTAGSFDNPYVKWSANGYRLPTEGEWQYAASYKNGTQWTPYNYASGASADTSDFDATSSVAWFGNSTAYGTGNTTTTKNVGLKNSNSLGLFDMSGNIWEWCWDSYEAYTVSDKSDYKGKSSVDASTERINRGGSYYNNDRSKLSVGGRVYDSPFDVFTNTGLRIARSS